uniref:Uncharacterized protein n=1 Tax=Macrostomum lignano TaxID=282301 RepID=A0A1I8FMP8_9PLAT
MGTHIIAASTCSHRPPHHRPHIRLAAMAATSPPPAVAMSPTAPEGERAVDTEIQIAKDETLDVLQEGFRHVRQNRPSVKNERPEETNDLQCELQCRNALRTQGFLQREMSTHQSSARHIIFATN